MPSAERRPRNRPESHADPVAPAFGNKLALIQQQARVNGATFSYFTVFTGSNGGTEVFGINDSGQVVGYNQFLYSGGTFITITDPDADGGTYPFAQH